MKGSSEVRMPDFTLICILPEVEHPELWRLKNDLQGRIFAVHPLHKPINISKIIEEKKLDNPA